MNALYCNNINLNAYFLHFKGMVRTILSSTLYSSAIKDTCKMPYRMAIPCLVAENLVMNQQREIFDLQLLLNLHFSPQEGI